MLDYNKKPSNTDIVEYAIFNQVRDRNVSLPGLINQAQIDFNFFSNLKGKFKTKDLQNWFEEEFQEEVKKQLDNNKAFLLASGGVDSSAVYLALSSIPESEIEILHTAYTEHDINDLNKLQFLLEIIPSNARICSLSAKSYMLGNEILWKKRLLQNTYAPTLEFALSKVKSSPTNLLFTGSGPDELFYGMEKYEPSFFKKFENISMPLALKQIDTDYNIAPYLFVFNNYGKEILNEVLKKRMKLYNEISKIESNIFNAQRLLAYTTVTSQHKDLFDTFAKTNNLTHKAPFLSKKLVEISFSIDVLDLIDLKNFKGRVESGKKHLKSFLSKRMSKKHVHSNKIGFHAPVTRFLHDKCFKKHWDMELDVFSELFNLDNLRSLLKERLSNKPNYSDYFLFSFLNLSNIFIDRKSY